MGIVLSASADARVAAAQPPGAAATRSKFKQARVGDSSDPAAWSETPLAIHPLKSRCAASSNPPVVMAIFSPATRNERW